MARVPRLMPAGVRPGDAAMRERLAAQDWLTTLVELDPAGLSAQVLGSMIDFVAVDPAATIAAMADVQKRLVNAGMTLRKPTGVYDARTTATVPGSSLPALPSSVPAGPGSP